MKIEKSYKRMGDLLRQVLRQARDQERKLETIAAELERQGNRLPVAP